MFHAQQAKGVCQIRDALGPEFGQIPAHNMSAQMMDELFVPVPQPVARFARTRQDRSVSAWLKRAIT